ncbi:hypothetical protein [Nocardia sp. NPDC052566]|uniref:hypothetical protein n=1 Tax=Nocardia sp. NPDC052566 TaxID=3364330 RepID=UPI0037C80D15
MNQGRAEMRAADALRVLSRRGIAVSEETRSRISATTDLELLERWFDRAITATTSDELFAD